MLVECASLVFATHLPCFMPRISSIPTPMFSLIASNVGIHILNETLQPKWKSRISVDSLPNGVKFFSI
jgi:hypothetical protein